MRVPLLLRWPRRTRARSTCDDPVGLTDVLHYPGGSIGTRPPRRPGAAARRKSARASPRGGLAYDSGREELYYLHTDPYERHSMTAAQPALTAAFRECAKERIAVFGCRFARYRTGETGIVAAGRSRYSVPCGRIRVGFAVERV